MASSPESPQLDPAALQGQLEQVQNQENRFEGRINGLQQHLGHLANRASRRAGAVYDASETIGERKITDHFKEDPVYEQANAPETAISRKTLGEAIGETALRYSLNGPRGDEIRAAEADRPDENPSGFLVRFTDKRNARSIRRQKIRQDNAKFAEATFSAGMGLGQKARTRTMLERHSEKKELRQAYRANEIDAHELADSLYAVKSTRVIMPVKAVRREIRRERAGAIHTLIQADQPIRAKIDKIRISRTEKKKAKTTDRLEETRARKAAIEAEIQKLRADRDDTETS